jgi:succinyl-diaminopimelate desuccinylase
VRFRLDPEPPSSDVFLTRNEALITMLSDAIEKVAGRRPALSTSGGTSDARFIKDYCPVVEFGPVGRTMHQVDECAPLAEIEAAAAIYEEFLAAYFPK